MPLAEPFPLRPPELLRRPLLIGGFPVELRDPCLQVLHRAEHPALEIDERVEERAERLPCKEVFEVLHGAGPTPPHQLFAVDGIPRGVEPLDQVIVPGQLASEPFERTQHALV